jgi:ATP-dependent protease Clp ATPase subunit
MGPARPAPAGTGLLLLGRRQRKARKLVAGPDVYICEPCVELAETVIRSGQATDTALGPLRSVPDTMAQRRCREIHAERLA